MRATSAASYQAALEVLRTRANDVTNDLGDTLFGITDLLGQNPGLVRAFTDPSRSGADKEQLVDRILAGQSPIVIAVMQALVGGRWSQTSDLMTAVEDLGPQAHLQAAVNQGQLADVEKELFSVGELLDEQRDLRTVLADASTYSVEHRQQLVQQLFAGKINATTLALVRRAVATVAHGRIRTALRHLTAAAADAMRARLVIVETAAQPSAAQLQRLREILQRKYGSDITINVSIDPELVGGMRIRTGSELIEGALSATMAQTRRALAGATN